MGQTTLQSIWIRLGRDSQAINRVLFSNSLKESIFPIENHNIKMHCDSWKPSSASFASTSTNSKDKFLFFYKVIKRNSTGQPSLWSMKNK